MNHEQKMRILHAMTYGPGFDLDERRTGICAIVRDYIPYEAWEDFDAWMRKAVVKWPHFSGSFLYPVDDGSIDSAEDQFYAARYEARMWDEKTEYGRLRWDLLRFLILEMLKEV